MIGAFSMGKVVLGIGVFLVLLGALIMLVERIGVPLGKLPGDISYRGKNTFFYFPLTTSILISVILSLVLYFISRLRR